MTIVIRSNIKEVREKLKQAKRALGRAAVKTHRGAAFQGQRFARSIAPVETGRLRNNIRIQRYKNSTALTSSAISQDSYRFPYHLWVNRNIRTIIGRWPYFTNGRRIAYGGASHSPSGKPIRWTGVPGYFDVTVEMIKKKFPQDARTNVNRALRAVWR